MTMFPAGPRNTITDVPGIRVSHLTRAASPAGGGRRTGLTVVFMQPPEGRHMRPAAVVASGGRTEVTGLCYVDDFGFIMSPIAITGLRAVGRVHDAMVTLRARVGWPPMVVGLDDGRLSAPREDTFSEAEIIGALEAATADRVPEGAVGAGAGLVAFGWKSGVGSASRRVTDDRDSHFVGAIAFLNLGRPDALRIAGAPPKPAAARTPGPSPLLGSAFVLVATDAPLDDRQCRRVAEATCAGLGRIGVVAGPCEGVVSAAVSTGVLMTRNDRTSHAIATPRSSDAVAGILAEAAAEAAEEAATRTLTAVNVGDGTAAYPTFPRG